MRVLIVDDAAVERNALRRILSDLGHHVVAEAGDLDAAIRASESCEIDMVVLDGRLPPDGCLPAMAALREAIPGVQTLVIAALNEIAFVRTAVAAGASGAIRRPFLRSSVEAALRDARSRA